MATVDDTFERLRRTPFDEMYWLMIKKRLDVMFNRDQNPDALYDLLRVNGWDHSDYTNALNNRINAGASFSVLAQAADPRDG